MEEEVSENNISNKKILKFPDNFLWGTSTSAYQIEGGIKNDWSEWEKKRVEQKKFKNKNLNPDDFISRQACDSYNRYEEDIELAKKLNTNAMRIGIEWSRIQPKKDEWNIDAINHYKKVLSEIKNQGMTTVCTLWHWTNPIWVAEENGWENKKTIDYFTKYTELIVKELGGFIDYWVVLNEPMVHIANGYISGKFPPNKKNILKANKVFNNLYKAYNKSYKIIHNQCPQAKVSITKLTNYFEPSNKWNLIEVEIAKFFHYFWNHRFLQKIKNNIDYIGLDYYFHNRIIWYPPFKKNLNKKTTDMGWEIYPKGIYKVLKYLNKFKKPILILENGLADKKDKYRADFINDHLYYVHKAIQEGVDVRGYFYWSLLDNFEWDKGYAPKFGLYSVDRKTFKRTPRPSSKVYTDICKNNCIYRDYN